MSNVLPIWPALPQIPAAPDDSQWVFDDPRSQDLLTAVRQAAASDASVLMLGPSGADAQPVARQVHAYDLRRTGPFVAVNCGAFSEALLDLELFGHEQGAVPGEFASEPGWLERAHHGTLFLDEVDQLPAAIQTRLMRALQERSVIRVGGRQRRPADVRVIAAPARPLPPLVAAGAFRTDLYYHLDVLRLDVAPLRERPGDVLPLARHFITVYCERLGHAPHSLTNAAQAALLAHPWPGNVRELENVVHRALLVCRGLHIEPGDLRLQTLDASPTCHPPIDHLPLEPAAARGASDADEALDLALARLCASGQNDLAARTQDAVLLAAWRHHQFNQVATARQLGLSRNAVRARLLRLGELATPHRRGVPSAEPGDR